MQKWVNLCSEPEIRRAHLTLHTSSLSFSQKLERVSPLVLAFVGWITRSTNYFAKITRKLLLCVCVCVIIVMARVRLDYCLLSPVITWRSAWRVKVTSEFFVARQIRKFSFICRVLSKLDGMLEIIMCNGNRRIPVVYCINWNDSKWSYLCMWWMENLKLFKNIIDK